jgi:hypothetical protein
LKVAQAVHAAGESAGVPLGTIAVALEAPTEEDLQGLSAKLDELEVPHVRVVEGEGEYTGQVMAIGVCPTDNRLRIRRATGGLPLVK